jgi:hypothetical protein
VSETSTRGEDGDRNEERKKHGRYGKEQRLGSYARKLKSRRSKMRKLGLK